MKPHLLPIALSLLALTSCGGGPAPPGPTPVPIPAPSVPVPGVAGDCLTDDHAAIQAALDAHGLVWLPATAACYRVSAPLWVTSGTELRIDGIVKIDGGQQPGLSAPVPGWPYGLAHQWGVVWIQEGATNVTIDGVGVIDGNRTLNLNCCLGGIVAGGPAIGDYGAGISNVTISGLTIQNVENWPVSIDGTNGATVSRLTVTNAGSSVQFAHGTTNAHADHITMSGIDDICFSFYNMVSHSGITNSTATGCKGSGFGVLTDSAIPADVATTGQSANITISGNTTTASNGGFDTNNGRERTVQYFSNVQFAGNASSGNALYGFGIMGCAGCAIQNSTSAGDGASLFVMYDVTGLTLTGNNFSGATSAP